MNIHCLCIKWLGVCIHALRIRCWAWPYWAASGIGDVHDIWWIGALVAAEPGWKSWAGVLSSGFTRFGPCMGLGLSNGR